MEQVLPTPAGRLHRKSGYGEAGTPIIWLATTHSDPWQLKRTATALATAGLPPKLELPAAELERRAEETGIDPPDVVVFAGDPLGLDEGVLRRLAWRLPYTRTVIVSSTCNAVVVRRALDMGVRGFVDERRLEQTLAAAVSAVSTGLLVMPPEARTNPVKPVFTHREKETLALMLDGLTNSEIASRLNRSESTVKSHLASAFAKLGVHSRSEAAALILDPESGLAPVALPPRRRYAPSPGPRPRW